MAEVCTPPVVWVDPDGTEWAAFSENHSLADIARWLMENPTEAAEVHTILGDMLWQHHETVGLTKH